MQKNHFFETLRSLLFGAAMVAACAALSCGTGLAADQQPVALSFYSESGHFKVEGSFFTDADRSTAWHVLTDYASIPHFVNSMKVSKVESQDEHDLVLDQEGEGGFLFFTQRIHLLLSVHEQPEKSIVFQDTSHKDFDYYQGSWTIKKADSGQGLEVIYTLDAQGHFDGPGFLVSDSIQGNVKDLLESVRREMGIQQAALDQKKSSKDMVAENPKANQLSNQLPNQLNK
ncbi:MAG TPA: SRPBCC family protein [bacterium]|nr:SRPBCC family protein [bacterium]